MSTNLFFSFIVPVYNRKEELGELLATISNQDFKAQFEVIIVDDGSTVDSKDLVDSFTDRLDLAYYHKDNSGPGDSRNYGMKRAKGNY